MKIALTLEGVIAIIKGVVYGPPYRISFVN